MKNGISIDNFVWFFFIQQRHMDKEMIHESFISYFSISLMIICIIYYYYIELFLGRTNMQESVFSSAAKPSL